MRKILKKIIPLQIRRNVKKEIGTHLNNFNYTKEKWRLYFELKKKPKIFCISVQRTGTTSVGHFFKIHGYNVAGWDVSYKNKWTVLWNNGDFEDIFKSLDFRTNQVFEDGPWWGPEFYKFLFHKFPGAKFVLFTRDSDQWFNSMISHSNGRTLGNTKLHCKVYRRENDFNNLVYSQTSQDLIDYKIDNLLTLSENKEHYINIYEMHNREVIEYFSKHSSESLFTCQLEDPLKWVKLGRFFGIDVPEGFEAHQNKSK